MSTSMWLSRAESVNAKGVGSPTTNEQVGGGAAVRERLACVGR
jgi:hypothetical protein